MFLQGLIVHLARLTTNLLIFFCFGSEQKIWSLLTLLFWRSCRVALFCLFINPCFLDDITGIMVG